jgi:p-hydroxybenzoate 3-monooxygenase
MHRSSTLSRFTLEVPAGEGFESWPDVRIWAELQDRLAAAGRPPIETGAFVERDILDHRVRVCEPMQNGRVFLAGDAAHLITPAGGKGMNIAIQDALELAAGVCDRYGARNDGHRLARYFQTRLPQVWRQQEFSNLMLSLFKAGNAAESDDAGATSFLYGLGRARLDLVLNARDSRVGSPTPTSASMTRASSDIQHHWRRRGARRADSDERAVR